MFDKLNEIDQLYANNLLSKCKGCISIESCKQENVGMIPTTIYDELTHKYNFAFKRCKYARGHCNNSKVYEVETWEHPQKDMIIKHIKEHKSIFLFGDVGTGKTRFLYWLANQLNKKGKDVHIDNITQITKSIKDSFNQKSVEGESTLLDKLQNVEYLFLDDIGNERKTEYNLVDILWPLIDYRYVNGKATFITSNYTLLELYEMYGEVMSGKYGQKQIRPIMSRLKTFGEVKLEGVNFRL